MSSTQGVNKHDLDMLVSMGFDRDNAEVALTRANGDVEYAVDILSRGVDADDAEFDLIATGEPEPQIHPPTVFHPRTEREEPDHFREGSNTVGEMVDSRIQSLVAMGFPAADAESALKRSNNDVNEALNLLLSSA